MTRPIPNDYNDDPEELRKRWFLRFLRVQARYDMKVKTALIHSAESAYNELLIMSTKRNFSSSVRSAQIRLIMQELNEIMKELFGEVLPIIKEGQKDAAKEAVVAFTHTDIEYLRRAFRSTGAVDQFVEGQQRQAAVHVVQAISNVKGREKYNLSEKVYHTRQLATGWVRQQVTSGILRGDGAKEIAKTVRKSIRPTTPGGVSYAAMRLGRTEINNSFHATSIALSKDRPWVEGMLWNMSKVHEIKPSGIPEICETYSGQVFEVNNVPPKPHPQCRCYVTPQLEPFDVFTRHLTAGSYRSWIDDAA